MDVHLHCNRIDCRSVLKNTRVCLTTCSHVFCEQCASDSFERALVCPACDSPLTEKDDIVLVQLALSESKKSTILAGHAPDVIMDIASRAIAFWNYQMTQESLYQTLLKKEVEDKAMRLERKLATVIQEANSEILAIKDKLTCDVNDFELEKKKYADLYDQYQEKCRQFKKLQGMYDKLKRKAVVDVHQASLQPESSTRYLQESNQLDASFYQSRIVQQPMNRGSENRPGFPSSIYGGSQSLATPCVSPGQKQGFNFKPGSFLRNQSFPGRA